MSKLKRFPKYKELYKDGVLLLNSYNLESLTNLVEVVVNKYFSSYNNREEFVSIGLSKVIEILKLDLFDPVHYPKESAFKNFLFTSVRNALSNHVYHYYNNNKELLSEVIPDISEAEEVVSLISIKTLKDFVNTSIFNIDFNMFYSYLLYLGFPIEYSKENITSLADINESFYNKITCLFIHDYFNNLT